MHLVVGGLFQLLAPASPNQAPLRVGVGSVGAFLYKKKPGVPINSRSPQQSPS
jgi:hypothetical protein